MTILCTAFAGPRRIAAGPLLDVALAVKAFVDADPDAAILVFDNADSQQVELDLRGSAADITHRMTANTAPAVVAAVVETETARGPGRPKLGVVGREVTLLPRHWEWLAQQPGGASVVLRKLVDEARRGSEDKDAKRRAQEVAYRFMSAIAGDQPQFEAATRALFASDRAPFEHALAAWPHDLRDHALQLAQAAFAA